MVVQSNEISAMRLVKTYCLPTLLHGCEAPLGRYQTLKTYIKLTLYGTNIFMLLGREREHSSCVGHCHCTYC